MMGARFRPQKKPWYFAAAFFLSVCVHVILWLQFSHMSLVDAAVPHQPRFIEVALVAESITQEEAPQQASPDIVKAQPKIQEKTVVQPKETTVIKKEKTQPKVVKKAVKKVAKKKVTKQVIKKSVDVVKPIVSSRATPTNHVVKVHASPRKQTSLKQLNNIEQLAQLKRQYLSRVLSVIQSHKHYPYSARRRHIEGDVHVSFRVDRTGQISELHITDGSSVLQRSTQQAIEDSLPLPLPSKSLPAHTYSQFTMVYRLD